MLDCGAFDSIIEYRKRGLLAALEGSSLASTVSGDAKAPIRRATDPISSTALAKPAEARSRKGARVFCHRISHLARLCRVVRLCSCDRATRNRRARSGGALAGPR